MALKYLITDRNNFLNVAGQLYLNQGDLNFAVIGGNTEINGLYGDKSDIGSILTASNSNFGGNLVVKSPKISNSYIEMESSIFTVGHNTHITDANYSFVKGEFQLETDNIFTQNFGGRDKSIEDSAYSTSRNAALQIGHTDGRYISESNASKAPIHFMVNGSSNIHLGNAAKTEQNDKAVRSAVGLNTPGFGSVLVLSETYDANKHSAERYKNKVHFGERSTIHTEADYSHGLLLSSQATDHLVFDGNQVSVNNKGKIQVDGKASAISAYLYRIGSIDTPPSHEPEVTSKRVDGVDFTILSAPEEARNPTWQPYKVDSNLPGKQSAYILPSLLNNKDFFDKEDPNFELLFTESPDSNKGFKYLAHAKKYFDPNEKVIEVNNSGELIAPNGYVFSGSMFKDVFTSTGGKLDGKLVLNNGSDEVSLAKTDLTKLTELNGAETSGREPELKKTVKMTLPSLIDGNTILGGNVFVNIDLPQAINALNLDQELTGSSTSNGQANDTKITNWDIINIGKNAEAKLNLTGDLNDGWDAVNNKSADNFDESLRKKELNIGHLGTVTLVNTRTSASVHYNVNNAGTIDLTSNEITDDVFTIEGNYKGDNGKLLVNSLWHNPDNQENDQLVIKGNASGKTTVEAKDGIKGNVTLADKEIKNGKLANPVVIIEGKDEGRFIGKAMTENAGEAQLRKSVVNGKSQYHWTLGIKDDELEIINKPSTAYVQSQAVARELGFMTLGRLNHRLGEWTNSTDTQTWLRTRFEDDFLNGKNRFAAKSQRYLVQLGQDVALWQDNDKVSHLGVTFSHSKANAKFFDKYRAENGEVISNKLTTEAKLTALSLGGYFTQRYNNGAYVDFTGQLSHLKFNYLGEAQAKQKGYAIGASVEVGYPIALNSIWDVEPQAQLSYQHIRLSAFSDAQQRQIAKQTSNNLRARLGVRLVANKQLYLGANLHYDLIGNQSKANVGRSHLAEKQGRLTAELNLGGKIDLSKNVSVNIEAHYKKNLSKGHNAVHLQNSRSPTELGGQIRLQVRF